MKKKCNLLFNPCLSLETDKTRPISQPNFSQKIEDVFYKVYKEPICDRYLRMSWISGLMKTNPTKKEMKELARLMAHSTDERIAAAAGLPGAVALELVAGK